MLVVRLLVVLVVALVCASPAQAGFIEGPAVPWTVADGAVPKGLDDPTVLPLDAAGQKVSVFPRSTYADPNAAHGYFDLAFDAQGGLTSAVARGWDAGARGPLRGRPVVGTFTDGPSPSAALAPADCGPRMDLDATDSLRCQLYRFPPDSSWPPYTWAQPRAIAQMSSGILYAGEQDSWNAGTQTCRGTQASISGLVLQMPGVSYFPFECTSGNRPHTGRSGPVDVVVGDLLGSPEPEIVHAGVDTQGQQGLDIWTQGANGRYCLHDHMTFQTTSGGLWDVLLADVDGAAGGKRELVAAFSGPLDGVDGFALKAGSARGRTVLVGSIAGTGLCDGDPKFQASAQQPPITAPVQQLLAADVVPAAGATGPTPDLLAVHRDADLVDTFGHGRLEQLASQSKLTTDASRQPFVSPVAVVQPAGTGARPELVAVHGQARHTRAVTTHRAFLKPRGFGPYEAGVDTKLGVDVLPSTPGGPPAETAVPTVDWTFGDGATASVPPGEVVHRWAEPGTYWVEARGTNGAGDRSSTKYTVDVLEQLRLQVDPAEERVVRPGTLVTVRGWATGGGKDRQIRVTTDGVPSGDGIGPNGELETDVTSDVEKRVTVTFKVTDEHGFEDTRSTTIVFDAGADAVPLDVKLTASSLVPEVGDRVTLTATGIGGSNGKSYAFDLDGDGAYETDTGASPTASFAAAAPGSRVVGVRVTDFAGRKASRTARLSVANRLVPAFTTDPPDVESGQVVELDARATRGGTAPLKFRFDVDGNGSFETSAGSTGTVERAFDDVGSFDVGLQVVDAEGRTRTATRKVVVTQGCRRLVEVKLAKVRADSADGCLRKRSRGGATTYAGEGSFSLNNLPIKLPSGTKYTLHAPSSEHPGGALEVSGGSVAISGVTLFSGSFTWELPNQEAPKAGGTTVEAKLSGVGMPRSTAKVLGLGIAGGMDLFLGVKPDGESFVKLRGNVEVPGFKVGEGRHQPEATAKFGLTYGQDGLVADGVKLRLENAYVGSLKIKDVCLAYVAKGTTDLEGCSTFKDFRGEPFLQCKTDTTVDRWSGTVDVSFPFGNGESGIAASFGVAGGSLSELGMKAELGRNVAVKPGKAWLKSIAAGVCLKPDFEVRGEASFGVIPDGNSEAFQLAGGFHYKSATTVAPWSFAMTGTVKLKNVEIGRGYLSVDGNYTIKGGASMTMNLPSEKKKIATINGQIDGWIETQADVRFNLEGSLRACVASLACVSAEGVLSSDGVAACGTLFSARIPYPDIGKWYWRTKYAEVLVRGGFGYRWGGSVDLMGSSCDIGPWRAQARTFLRTQGFDGGQVLMVEPPVAKGVTEDPVLTLRAFGTGAPPRLRLTGPDGTVVESPAAGPAAEVPGKWRLIEDADTGTTNVQVFLPAAGAWKLEPIDGSVITKVDRADYVAPASIDSQVTRGKGRRRTLTSIFVPQPGTRVALYEVGRGKGSKVRRKLGVLRDRACPADGLRKMQRTRKSGAPGAKATASDVAAVRCEVMSFVPAFGPAGKRDVIAEISRDGVPVENRRVATYTAPAPLTAGRVRGLRLVRGGRSSVVSWASAPNARRYDVTVRTASGFRRLFDRGEGCRVVRLPSGFKRSRMVVSVTAIGVRGERGKPRTVTLRAKGGEARVGAKVPAPRRCG